MRQKSIFKGLFLSAVIMSVMGISPEVFAKSRVIPKPERDKLLFVELCVKLSTQGLKKISDSAFKSKWDLPYSTELWVKGSASNTELLLIDGFEEGCSALIRVPRGQTMRVEPFRDELSLGPEDHQLNAIFDEFESTELAKCQTDFEKDVVARLVARGKSEYAEDGSPIIPACFQHVIASKRTLTVITGEKRINLSILGDRIVYWEST